MKRFAIFVVLAAACAAPSAAAGNANTGDTIGNCISDSLYGNEPNMANGAPGGPAEQAPGTNGGNVLPTQSPGPFTNVPNDPDNPLPGNSVGDYNQMAGGGAVPAACRALAQ